MKKTLMIYVIACMMLGASTLAQASPVSGWWDVKNTSQSSTGSLIGWNVCIKADGKWYMNEKGHLNSTKGNWVSEDDWTMLVGINSGETPSGFAGAFMLENISWNSMRGAYIYSSKGSGVGNAYDNLLTYKGKRCAPMKKVNAPFVKKPASKWQPPKKPVQKQTASNGYDMAMSNDYTGSNMCLMARGSVVWLRSCTGSTSDSWAVVPSGKNFLIKNKNSGVARCLGARQNGLLFVGQCRPDLNFNLWYPEVLKGFPERTRLRNRFTGPNKCLAVSSKNGRNIPMVLPCGNYTGQKWY